MNRLLMYLRGLIKKFAESASKNKTEQGWLMILMCHIEKSTLNQLTKSGENVKKSFLSVTYYVNT